MHKVEAYYGDPSGGCSCPAAQQLEVDDSGSLVCPGDVDYTDVTYGECTEENDEDDEAYVACLEGRMWTGARCCAYGVDKNKAPDFSELVPSPRAGCNSATAQYIAQGYCVGEKSCEITNTVNETYSWTSTNYRPCINGATNGSTCRSSLVTAAGNFTQCASSSERSLIMRALCYAPTLQVEWLGIDEKKTAVGKTVSYIDSFVTLMLLFCVLWMNKKERELNKKQCAQ